MSDDKRQQVIALGRLGWPLRRIQKETGVRRETAGTYLKAADVPVRPPGGWGRRSPAKPANEVAPNRYERSSTLLTSNRPVNDYGKLLGNTAAVGSMLDRVLHHGHVLRCGPRSWRTKTSATA